jgi:hypothetical protein
MIILVELSTIFQVSSESVTGCEMCKSKLRYSNKMVLGVRKIDHIVECWEPKCVYKMLSREPCGKKVSGKGS